jgi:hypothetical protein
MRSGGGRSCIHARRRTHKPCPTNTNEKITFLQAADAPIPPSSAGAGQRSGWTVPWFALRCKGAGDDRRGRPGSKPNVRNGSPPRQVPLRRVKAGDGATGRWHSNLDAHCTLLLPQASSSPGTKCGNPAPVIRSPAQTRQPHGWPGLRCVRMPKLSPHSSPPLHGRGLAGSGLGAPVLRPVHRITRLAKSSTTRFFSSKLG